MDRLGAKPTTGATTGPLDGLWAVRRGIDLHTKLLAARRLPRGTPGNVEAHSQSYKEVRRPAGKPPESFGGCAYYLQHFGNGTHSRTKNEYIK